MSRAYALGESCERLLGNYRKERTGKIESYIDHHYEQATPS